MKFFTKLESPVSANLAAVLIGTGITIWAWFSHSPWPAWPAFGAMTLAFGSHLSFATLPYAIRVITTILLIAVNVAAWAIVVRSVRWLWGQAHLRLPSKARR